MNPIFLFLIPVGMIVLFLGTHIFFTWLSNRREERKDAEKKKIVDDLLAVDLQDWYEQEFINS